MLEGTPLLGLLATEVVVEDKDVVGKVENDKVLLLVGTAEGGRLRFLKGLEEVVAEADVVVGKEKPAKAEDGVDVELSGFSGLRERLKDEKK